MVITTVKDGIKWEVTLPLANERLAITGFASAGDTGTPVPHRRVPPPQLS